MSSLITADVGLTESSILLISSTQNVFIAPSGFELPYFFLINALCVYCFDHPKNGASIGEGAFIGESAFIVSKFFLQTKISKNHQNTVNTRIIP